MPWTAYTDEELWQANVKLARFRRWAKANPDVLRWMYRTVRGWTISGKRSSMKRLFEQARYDSGIRIVDIDGDVRLSNDLSPLVARIMASSIAGTENVFTTKKSVFDHLDDSQVPRFDQWGTLVWGDES